MAFSTPRWVVLELSSPSPRVCTGRWTLTSQPKFLGSIGVPKHRGKMHCTRTVFLLPVNASLVLPQQTRFPVANFEKLKLQTSSLRLKNPEQLQYSFICFYTFAPRSFGLAPTAKNIIKDDSLRSHVAIVVTLLLSASCFVKTTSEKHVYEEWKNKEWQTCVGKLYSLTKALGRSA